MKIKCTHSLLCLHLVHNVLLQHVKVEKYMYMYIKVFHLNTLSNHGVVFTRLCVSITKYRNRTDIHFVLYFIKITPIL